MGDSHELLPKRQIVNGDFGARRGIVVEQPIAQDPCSGRVDGPDRVFAGDDPAIFLIEVGGERYVGRDASIVRPHAVDLDGQVDRHLPAGEAPRELDDRRPAIALPVHHELSAFVDANDTVAIPIQGCEQKLFRQFSALVGERFGVSEPRLSQTKGQLTDALAGVVPRIVTAQEPHHNTCARWNGCGYLEVLHVSSLRTA